MVFAWFRCFPTVFNGIRRYSIVFDGIRRYSTVSDYIIFIFFEYSWNICRISLNIVGNRVGYYVLLLRNRRYCEIASWTDRRWVSASLRFIFFPPVFTRWFSCDFNGSGSCGSWASGPVQRVLKLGGLHSSWSQQYCWGSAGLIHSRKGPGPWNTSKP